MPFVYLDGFGGCRTLGESGGGTNGALPLWVIYKGEGSGGMMGVGIQTHTTSIQDQRVLKPNFLKPRSAV